MDKESLNILLEVQSNSRRIEELNQKIKEENKRIHFVEGNRQKALKEIDEHEVNLNKILIESKKLDKEISQIETLIKRSSNNLDYAVNEIQANAAQKELDDLNTKLGQLESDQLDKWECADMLKKTLEERQKFKSGSETSLNKLKNEVSEKNISYNDEINKTNARKSELLNSLPSGIKIIFLKIEENKKPAVCFMDNKRCSQCATQIDQSLIGEIHSCRQICHCPTCGRILISPDVRY